MFLSSSCLSFKRVQGRHCSRSLESKACASAHASRRFRLFRIIPRSSGRSSHWWEDEGTFFKLRDRNRGGPTFSFMDGPITANNPMGVHHAWGRTLKDVFQRYKALRGFDQRYQNGFDCQGLWVEVEVEKSLGLNSKREIEEYGLAEFAERCKERVAHFAEVITEQSKRLGMWMDWENSYFTFSDTNIEYIWRFLKEVHGRGWLFKGHRSTQWCPRCGTSLSQHEQAGEENYVELEHPSLFVRFPLKERDNESLVVWTTTPWTLPANVAAAVKPDAEYGLTREGLWYRVEEMLDPDAYVKKARGEELVGLEYEGPFDYLPAQEGVVHRVIPWDEVSLDEGTGIVHIAPGCGAEDFELSRVHDLPVLMPIDESGRMLPGYGELEGRTTDAVAEPVDRVAARARPARRRRDDRPPLPDLLALQDAARLPRRRRLVHLGRGDPAADARRERDRRVDAALLLEAHGRLAAQHGRLEHLAQALLRPAAAFYPCECGHLNVIGSRAELEERATAGLDQLQELHRPWIDEVTIRCEACDREVERIAEVGDAWLDAGIVHFSTLGWQNPTWIEHGYATGAAAGLTGADLPDHAYWEKWFPADWVSEMREQIRLWFYSQSFMAVTLDGRAPYRSVLTYERVHDETGREMHKSTGNAIEANEALERMGADVMRWIYCAQVPSQNINFGYGPADEVKRRLLTFWNSVAFFVTYANVDGFDPEEPAGELQAARPLARRAHGPARARGDRGVRALLDAGRRRGVRALRRRSVELVHPPLAPALLGRRPDGAPRALGGADRCASGRLAADAVPHGASVAESRLGGRVGVPGPVAGGARRRRGAARGGRGSAARRRARPAGAGGVRPEGLRQPLRRLVVAGAQRAHEHARRSPRSCG